MPAGMHTETRAGEPIRFGGSTITPFSQALVIQLPQGRGGLVWNRPASILARSADGSEQVIPVPDVTRQALWALWGACALFLLLSLILGGKRRSD